MCRIENNKLSSMVSMALIMLGVFTLIIPAVTALECDQPMQSNKKCNSAYTKMETAHTVPHTCGGVAVDICVNGSCGSPDSGTCPTCDLGYGSIGQREYACDPDGSGGCTHTNMGGKPKDVCDC